MERDLLLLIDILSLMKTENNYNDFIKFFWRKREINDKFQSKKNVNINKKE